MYRTEEECRADLLFAYELMGSRSTTRPQFEQMVRSLVLMLLRCPDRVRSLVEAALLEATMRRPFFEVRVW